MPLFLFFKHIEIQFTNFGQNSYSHGRSECRSGTLCFCIFRSNMESNIFLKHRTFLSLQINPLSRPTISIIIFNNPIFITKKSFPNRNLITGRI